MNLVKKVILVILLTFVTCVVFNAFSLTGINAISDLASLITGIVYLGISWYFFKKRKKTNIYILLGCAMLCAAAFAILPLLIYFLNAITFIVNINYNDILFNYFKLYLNALFGLTIFCCACLIDLYLDKDESSAPKAQPLLTIIISIFLVTLAIMILRRLGYHISWSRILTKIILLLSVFVLLPYLFYSGLIKNKRFLLLFLTVILTLFNGINFHFLVSLDLTPTLWFSYTKPVRFASGKSVDTLTTLNSLKKITDNFYQITFKGDYTAILEANNKKYLEESINPGHFCSLFTSFGDSTHYLFARNFDNPQGWKCKTLLCRAEPSGGYSSLSLVRLADIGFDVSENLEQLPYGRRKALINSVFFTPDGINEKGVVVALASVESQRLMGDSSKAFINCSYLIREILDHSKNIDEAISTIKKYNVMNDVWSGSFDQHLLIADASGRSIIAEISNGSFQFVPNKTNWQVITNSPSYNVSISDQKKNCERFNTLSATLESSNGKINTDAALKLLYSIGHEYTEWSTVYDISQKEMTVIIDHDPITSYHFTLKTDSLNQNKIK